jgi:PTS system nitrogen regulatory IIA component
MAGLIDLAAYLVPQRVFFLEGAVLLPDALAQVATICTDRPEDQRRFTQALIEREAVGSTAVGGGAAIPHARLANWETCRIALGICRAGIPYAAPDGRPVQLLVAMAARDSDHHEHLRLLATLAQRLRQPGLVERVVAAEDAPSAYERFLAG